MPSVLHTLETISDSFRLLDVVRRQLVSDLYAVNVVQIIPFQLVVVYPPMHVNQDEVFRVLSYPLLGIEESGCASFGAKPRNVP